MNYSWSPSTTIPLSTTVFTVTGTDANGCTGSDTIRVKVVICFSGVSEKKESTQFKFFPSPCGDQLFFQTNGMVVGSVRIINITGAVVADYRIDTDTLSIDVSSLSSGVYFLQWEGGSGRRIERFIKE
jgi:hypothetical protein